MGALAHAWHWTPDVIEGLNDRELETWLSRLESAIEQESKANRE